MMASKGTTKTLFWLVVANVAATILHYVDNMMLFAHYPEPTWMTPHIVDAFWFVMTPFAVVGYRLVRVGAVRWGYVALYSYSAMSLLVLGHYRYAPMKEVSFRINALILLEVVMAVCLILFVAILQFSRRWREYGHA
ncbi:MAG TPA: hypothetical protein VM715_08185 [Candidatus Acidoferrum sp.]|jgi:hypothetical protein|nr:hypothetical protein [Candidatus Acidoferrum sp.]